MIPLGQAPSEPRRVLLIKPSSLGDVVTALPVLHGLRRTFPRAHVTWLLARGCAPLMEGQTELDEVMLFDRRRLGHAWRSPGALVDLVKFLAALPAGRFDWVIDLQGLLRSGIFSRFTNASVRAGFAQAREGAAVFYTHSPRVEAVHTVDRNIELARRLGIDARPEDMRLNVSPAARQWVEGLLRREGLREGEFLIAVPSTRWKTKQYPPRHWRTVVASLSRQTRIVLLGSPEDRGLCEMVCQDLGAAAVNLAGATSIPEFVAAIAASRGVMCSDSAAKFIASAVGVAPITVLGPTRVELTGPYLSGKAIVSPVPCQGCLKRKCRHITCMELIDPAEVIAAAREVLEEQRPQATGFRLQEETGNAAPEA